MKRFKEMFGFGKPQYRAPQVASVPEGQSSDLNGTYVNEEARQILIKICDGGNLQDMAAALGTLEVAKDIIKQTITMWHAKDAQRKSIITPNGRSHGR